MLLKDLRLELARYAKRTVAEGLTTGAGGNISASDGHAMLISPSGFSLEDIDPDLWVEVDISSGQIASNGLRPSSETLMHLSCYRRRRDVRAIVHTHPRYTIALTSSGHDLKPIFADAVIYLGKRIPHLEYITVTTPELAEAVGRNVDATTLAHSRT